MPIPHLKPITELQKRIAKFRRNQDPKKPPLGRRIAIGISIAIVALMMIGGIGFVGLAAWVARDLPDPNKLMTRSVPLSTKIYDRTGKVLLYEIHGDERRTLINLEDLPPYIAQATIAAEDRDFYKHKGFSIAGILRSLARDVLTGSRVGGSTITQQLVKNAILTNEKTITRKVKEVILAWQIESRFSKDQILKLYLNEIPYGKTAYGIEAAARVYFAKSAKDLTLAETATIVGMVQAPTAIWNNKDRLEARKTYVLDGMVSEGYITQEEADKAKSEKLVYNKTFEAIIAPHFVEYVEQILTERYGEKAVEQGGLSVTTTLDADKQKIGEEIVLAGAKKNETKYKAANASLVAIDTKTGDILTMVGSRDYFDDEHDGKVNIATRLNQPGSSLKPLVYATALEKGLTPDTVLFDVETKFKTDTKDYVPHDYDGKERGPLTLKKALGGSLNIPAVKALYIAGIDNVLKVAKDFGYTTFEGREGDLGLAMVLGGADVTLLEHTAAFSVFAREGVRHPARAILRVEDSKGKILEEANVQEFRVFDEQVARNINNILSDNNNRAFIFGSRNLLTLSGRPVAAKTGTTNDWRDGWTMGYTPSIAVGVWAGNNDNAKMRQGADGVYVAAPIWNEFMKKVLAGSPVEVFKKPTPIKTDKPILNGQFEVQQDVLVDRVTQTVIPAECADLYPKDFIATKTVKSVHDTLFWVSKEDPRGEAPKNPASDPQFERWEAAAQTWAKDHGYTTASLPQGSCDLRNKENAPTVSITSPEPNATASSGSVLVSAQVLSSRTIARVEYFLDNLKQGETTAAPYDFALSLASAGNGFHDILVRATDDVGNSTDQIVTINVIANTPSTITFHVPSFSLILTSADFPYTIPATVSDPDGVSSVSARIKSATGDDPLMDITAPQTSELSFVIPAQTPPADLRFYLTVTDNKGSVTQSDYLILAVQ